MTRRFRLEEKVAILNELARADGQREKSEILARHGLDKKTVYKWRESYRKGRLGAGPGRIVDPLLRRLQDQAIARSQVLAELREHDAALASDDDLPTPEDLESATVEEMMDLIDDEVVPWSGAVDTTWDKRAAADMKTRISRRRAKQLEGDPTFVDASCDYLGDVPTNTAAEACRDLRCPCRRLCRVHHFHIEASTGDEGLARGVPSRPPKVVCTSETCVINRYCLSKLSGSPYHVHWPRQVPEVDLTTASEAASWRSAEDCPWHEVCDLAHARPDESEMEVAATVQATWQPVRLWCVDPDCLHHRRGNPHVHCRECNKAWPACVRPREIDFESMTRVDDRQADGLCEECYFAWRKTVLGKGDSG